MAFLTGERQFREIQLHDDHHVPSHPGRHVARKGRGTMDISCSVCDLQMHHFADIQYEKQIYSSTCLALVCIFNIFHLIFLRYIINNSSKTCPSINSEFLLPIFCHIPHLPWVPSPYFLSHSPSPPSICHAPGTEGVLLALRLGPGGGLPKLDQRGADPLMGWNVG